VPGLALSRVGARVLESDTHDVNGLTDQAWQRLVALPDPRSPQGLIYPLPCLIAAAMCAMTAAGHDGLTAIGQWLGQATQADLARLRMPRDPWTGIYRAPDEKTIRRVIDRLDPRALTRVLLGPRRRRRSRRDGSPSKKLTAYRARRAAAARKALARNRIRGLAVDGKTSRGARRADGTRVHLLGVVEHGTGRLLDHLEVDVKHNETSHFTDLLAELDLGSVAVTFDALHTVRANLNWLVTTKKAHYVAVVII
jgi:DDE_Tnp_1-associated